MRLTALFFGGFLLAAGCGGNGGSAGTGGAGGAGGMGGPEGTGGVTGTGGISFGDGFMGSVSWRPAEPCQRGVPSDYELDVRASFVGGPTYTVEGQVGNCTPTIDLELEESERELTLTTLRCPNDEPQVGQLKFTEQQFGGGPGLTFTIDVTIEVCGSDSGYGSFLSG